MPKKSKKQTDTDFMDEARKNFRNSSNFESDNRSEGLDDLRFKLGGTEQWPDDIVKKRTAEDRPILTINKLPTFTDQVIGDSRQNKISIKVRPTGKEAKPDVAKIINGLIRNIEKESDSDAVYQWGLQGAVDSGRGAWRVITDFVDDNVFEQEIRLKRIANSYSVYFDPKFNDPTAKDGEYLFITQLISGDEYRDKYGGEPSSFSELGLGDDVDYWFVDGQYRIAEYWLKEPAKKKIYLLSDGKVVDGDKWDQIVDELRQKEETIHMAEDGTIQPGPAEMPGEPETTIDEVAEIVKERVVNSHKVVQYIIDGAKVLEGPNAWAGKYIPVVPIWGKEINIEGQKHFRGLIRNAKDPQSIYNWERTEEVERVALAKKPATRLTPEQIEGHEAMWEGESPYKYQLYNHVPGQPPPIDTPAPQVSTGNVAQSAIANDEIHSTTGLEKPNIGLQSGSGSSGRKELVLQRKGDIGTFEYHDNLVRAIKFTGDILVDLIPKIYDNERTITILGEDDAESVETINQVVVDDETDEEVILNDLSIGKYSVSTGVGPSFSTQQLETFQTLREFAKDVPIVGTIGADLMAKNLSFRGSEELAERLRKMLPRGLVEDDDKKGENTQDQPPDPEQIKLALDIQGKQLDNEKKQLEIQEQMIELQKLMGEMQGQMKQVAQGAAQGAVQQVLATLGIVQDGEGEQVQ